MSPNPVDVGRRANELSAEYGLGAHRQARQRAEEAQKSGQEDEAAFWEAVADELSPHCSVRRPVR